MNTTNETETSNTTPVQASATTQELPAFGHTWTCGGCSAVMQGYKLLCDRCEEC